MRASRKSVVFEDGEDRVSRPVLLFLFSSQQRVLRLVA